MQNKKTITFLSLCIALLSSLASSIGIFSTGGPGPFEFITIHGHKVLIYGYGIYKFMSADVAPQGIAQDIVTLFIAIPVLLVSLHRTVKGSLRAKAILTGTLGYFLVTYLFYLMMAMMNVLFLIYVTLVCASFFGFVLSLQSIDQDDMMHHLKDAPTRFSGIFLIFCAVSIGLLWLQIIIPPLFYGDIPVQVQQYTTLVVQGLDLAFGLPAAFVSGYLMLKHKPFGFVIAPVYTVFLSVLMTALTAKIIAMGLLGTNIFPVVIIIPAFNALAITSAFILIKNIPQYSNPK